MARSKSKKNNIKRMANEELTRHRADQLNECISGDTVPLAEKQRLARLLNVELRNDHPMAQEACNKNIND